jgi:hypothetical protein
MFRCLLAEGTFAALMRHRGCPIHLAFPDDHLVIVESLVFQGSQHQGSPIATFGGYDQVYVSCLRWSGCRCCGTCCYYCWARPDQEADDEQNEQTHA